ncbi:universal stress protein A-like protein isoform X2 [Diospyros lotus]|uniref:universal stress protein A-like protein isoform X2 n=1 Tax=Diospyros lotus TaxID=55363 RepID=UPI00224F7346|nr:universal stress protein A-like protein isoform X2 [Diospyros lotus]
MGEEIKMTKEKRIMVAVDESEESMYALSWCLTNLLSHNTNKNMTLLLFYVQPPPPLYSSSFEFKGYLFGGDVIASMEKYWRELSDSVMSRAEDVCRGFDTDGRIRVEKKVGRGDAKEVICTAAERLGADILVMGCHDYGFFKRALLGSVSNYCAKNAKCPVVVVKLPRDG